MRIEYLDKNCCGCSGCYNICNQNAISMLADTEGFLYPKINGDICVKCGMCDKVCPILNNKESKAIYKALACKNRNEKIRYESTSGGIFSILADYILENNGVVFGASFGKSFKVVHIYTEFRKDISLFRGSKYVQSEIGLIYRKVKEILLTGRKVLFSGTPCQIAGLKGYLSKNYENLMCIDVVCHGVPSPYVWEKYVKYRAEDNGSSVRNIAFREKKYGWKQYTISFFYDNGTIYRNYNNKDLFMKGFLHNLILRPSCYNCDCKNFTCGSDLTLADYWKVSEMIPDIDDNTGVSLVFINTVKGEDMINKIQESMYIETTDYAHAISTCFYAIKSVNPHKNRKKFFDLLNNNIPIDKCLNQCLKEKVVYKIKFIIMDFFIKLKVKLMTQFRR